MKVCAPSVCVCVCFCGKTWRRLEKGIPWGLLGLILFTCHCSLFGHKFAAFGRPEGRKKIIDVKSGHSLGLWPIATHICPLGHSPTLYAVNYKRRWPCVLHAPHLTLPLFGMPLTFVPKILISLRHSPTRVGRLCVSWPTDGFCFFFLGCS